MVNEDAIVNNGHSSENRSEKHHHKSSHKSKDHSKDKSKHKEKHRDKDKEKSKHKDRHDKDKEKKHSSQSSSSTSHSKSSESASHSSSSAASKSHKPESDGKKTSKPSSSSSSSSHHHHHQHKKSSSSSSSSGAHKSKSSKDGSSDKHKSSAGKHGDSKAKLKVEADAEVKNELISQDSNGNGIGYSLDSSCDYDFAKFKTLKEEQEEDERTAKAANNGVAKNEDEDEIVSGSRRSKHAKPLLSDDESDFKCENDNNGFENTDEGDVKRENGLYDTKSEPDNSIKNEEENGNADNDDEDDDDADDEEYGQSNAEDDEDVEDSKDFNDNDTKNERADDNDGNEDEAEEEEEVESEEEEQRAPKKKSKKSKSKKRRKSYSDEDDDDNSEDDDYDDDSKAKSKRKRKHESSKSRKSSSTPAKKPPAEKKPKVEADTKNVSANESGKKRKSLNSSNEKPSKRVKKEETEEVWKWWEEEKKDDGVKWNFLEHKGPMFAPPYEPLPKSVKFYYDGKHVALSQDAEEIAGFYAKMLENDYTTKPIFNTNFFADWRKSMTHSERKLITDLKKCNFKEMHSYFVEKSEQNRNKTKEEKQALKEKNEEIINEYGYCIIDGHKERIANFRIEPPGLFRGRGEHPKMGMLKKRVMPEDVMINCSKDSKKPSAPEGHRWKEVRHDCTVTWLASWTENVQNQVKYVMLNPSSKIKGEKDWQKYEVARKLAKTIDRIRDDYREDWKSKEMRVRQRAVALYFIDRLALRAGNEKDEDQADTVGCCSLRVEHIQLAEHKDGKDYVVIFDFLGKDSIRYYNEVPVEKRVFKNLQLFMENKSPSDDLFDRLNTGILNKHLTDLMPGLTAKVFRTYNASFTLQDQLDKLTVEDNKESEKMLSYNRANRAVAILCNHQRSVPKSHQKSMEALREKIEKKKETISEAEDKVADAKRKAKSGSVKEKMDYDRKKKQLERLRDQLIKLNVQETDRDENKTIALGTSKLNYLDPRISVAWCKKYNVSIEKVYNKTQRMKFRWAIDMADADYRF